MEGVQKKENKGTGKKKKRSAERGGLNLGGLVERRPGKKPFEIKKRFALPENMKNWGGGGPQAKIQTNKNRQRQETECSERALERESSYQQRRCILGRKGGGQEARPCGGGKTTANGWGNGGWGFPCILPEGRNRKVKGRGACLEGGGASIRYEESRWGARKKGGERTTCRSRPRKKGRACWPRGGTGDAHPPAK